MTSSSSKTDPPGASPAPVVVGRILRPHGLRGEVVVEVLSDLPERFAKGSRLALSGSPELPATLEVAASRPAPTGLRVAFQGIGTREQAEALRDAELRVARAEVPPPPAGSYYFFELLGCRAFDAREGELGEVADLVEGPAGLLLVVERADGTRLPIPFVESFLVAVDREAKRIDWRLPEGFVEACASRF